MGGGTSGEATLRLGGQGLNKDTHGPQRRGVSSLPTTSTPGTSPPCHQSVSPACPAQSLFLSVSSRGNELPSVTCPKRVPRRGEMKEAASLGPAASESVPGREMMPIPVAFASEAYPPPPAEPRTGRVPPGSRLHRCPRLAARSAPECVSSLGAGEGKVARPQPLLGRIGERGWHPSRSRGVGRWEFRSVGARNCREEARRS